ncbi:MAG: hypothetical protein ABEJ30_00905 [Halorientalis sp.]
MNLRERFDHPSWFSVGGVAVGYLVVLVAIFVLLFLVPFAIFSAL